MTKKFSILMVCTGNICRSPTAEVVLRKKLTDNGCADFVSVDSAGTYSGHTASPPDSRSQHHAQLRGYNMDHLKARTVTEYDIDEFDLILGMEYGHLHAMKKLADTPEMKAKIQLYLDFSSLYQGQDMADPYYDGDKGFETVLDQIENTTDGIIDFLKEKNIIPA